MKRKSRKAPPKKKEPTEEKREWKPWTLWERGVSKTFAENFLRCRLTTKLSFIDGLVPEGGDRTPLNFGWCFHEIMEEVYKNHDKHPGDAVILKYAQAYEKANNKDVLPSQQDKWQETIGLVYITACEYFRYYPRDFKREWIRTEVESKFKIPYEYPDGELTWLVGVLDAAYKSKRGDIIFDTKTSSRIDEEHVMEMFPLNFQMNMYMHYWKRVYNRMPKGCEMNYVRRTGLKRGQKSLPEYLEHVRNDIRKRCDFYFRRIPYSVTEKSLQLWEERQLHPIMQEIRMWAEGKLPTFANPVGQKIGMFTSRYLPAVAEGDMSDLRKRDEEPFEFRALSKKG